MPENYYLDLLPIEAYKTLAMPVFIKNTHSQYLWANDFFISQSAGYQSVHEIYKKNDHHFVWRDYADELISNDQLLFTQATNLSVCERILRHSGDYVEIVSQKCPLYNNKQQIIGLIGFSIALPKSGITSLSKREDAAVLLLSEGYTDKQIAKKWGVSPRTVESHINNAKRKTGVHSRAELIAKFCRHHP